MKRVLALVIGFWVAAPASLIAQAPQTHVIGTRQRIVHRRVQSRFRARISREHVIDLGADSWEILQFLADHLYLQDSIDDMLCRLGCFGGARKKIRIAVSLDATFGDHLYEDAAGHSEVVRRRDQRLGVRHFQNRRLDIYDFSDFH